jgi:type 1 glutamine amidotransferase
MNRRSLGSLICWAAIAFFGVLCPARAADAPKIRVLIVDGYNNHDWRQTTAMIQAILAQSDLFDVSVSTAPAKAGDPAWATWRPKFSDYDVVIQNCNDYQHPNVWPEPVQKDFENFVRNGGGVYIFHGAENAFLGWTEYEKMVALLWRKADYGTSIRMDANGKMVRIPPGIGSDTNHGARGDVLVTRLGNDPIHAGMPRQWLSPYMEVYYYTRGPAKHVHVLADAHDSKPGQGLLWPVEWTVSYGKGRIYVSTYGHIWPGDVQPVSMRCAAVQTLIPRAIQWLAHRPVTIPVPADFPTATAVSVRPPFPSLPQPAQ